MRDMYVKLIKRYLDLSLVVTETTITGEEKNKKITIKKNRASVSYSLKNDHGEYDDKATQSLHDDIKIQTADELFQMTLVALKVRNSEDRPDEKDQKSHLSKFIWSYGKLLELKIISLDEIIPQEELQDEEGDLIGYKRLRQEKDSWEDEIESGS